MMLRVDDLLLEVRTSARRKTLQLTVDRRGELVVYAPQGVPTSKLERFVRDKKMWVYTTLAKKALLQTEAPVREMRTGEGFHYLGRTYRLQLVRAQDRPLKLHHGRFRLRRRDRDQGREHFVRWYTEHAAPWLSRRVEELQAHHIVHPTGIEVRDLGHRWGSCAARGVLNFHWASILLPPSIIEYVIVHELAHLRDKHHTPAFWRRVAKAMPDYEMRKDWLAENGAGFARI